MSKILTFLIRPRRTPNKKYHKPLSDYCYANHDEFLYNKLFNEFHNVWHVILISDAFSRYVGNNIWLKICVASQTISWKIFSDKLDTR